MVPRAAVRVPNILTFDLEDWHALVRLRVTGELRPSSGLHLARQMDRLLGLLDSFGARATFFILGSVAEAFPAIVKRTADAGHEIATHGHRHGIVFRMSREEFSADVDRSRRLLEDLTGRRVHGYRAPEFSITRSSLWALDALAELGFAYDSSIFPIVHRRYGIPGFSRRPVRLELPSGRRLVEFPLSTRTIGPLRFPASGGGYYRWLPVDAILQTVKRLNRDRLPLVYYGHPYEFDPSALDIFETFTPTRLIERLRSIQLNLHQNIGQSSMASKMAALLGAFRFVTCGDYLKGEKNFDRTKIL